MKVLIGPSFPAFRHFDLIARVFGWYEEHNAFDWHVDTRADLWITASPTNAFARTKAFNPSNLHLVSYLQGSNHSFEHRVDDGFTVSPVEVTWQKMFRNKV